VCGREIKPSGSRAKYKKEKKIIIEKEITKKKEY